MELMHNTVIAPPAGIMACLHNDEEYLTIEELAQRLKVSPKTIRNKISSRVFQRGLHYHRPPGMAPRFKWSAVVAWLETEESSPFNERQALSNNASQKHQEDGIPMARGYTLGGNG